MTTHPLLQTGDQRGGVASTTLDSCDYRGGGVNYSEQRHMLRGERLMMINQLDYKEFLSNYNLFQKAFKFQLDTQSNYLRRRFHQTKIHYSWKPFKQLFGERIHPVNIHTCFIYIFQLIHFNWRILSNIFGSILLVEFW